MFHMSTTRKLIMAIALLLAATLVVSSLAQDKPAPKAAADQAVMMRITVTQMPNGMVPEWQNYQKNEVIPMMQKAGLTQSYVWRTATFGEAGEFIIARPMKDLSELDAPSPLVKALGQEAATALATGMAAKAQRFNAWSRTFMLTGRPDLSIELPAGYAPKLAVMATTDVAPGRTEEYEKYSKEGLPVIRKTNVKGMLVGRVGLGGNPNQYITFVMFDSFTDLDQFGAAYTKAAAEAKLAPTPPGIVTNTEWTTVRYVPELSIQPAASKAAKQ